MSYFSPPHGIIYKFHKQFHLISSQGDSSLSSGDSDIGVDDDDDIIDDDDDIDDIHNAGSGSQDGESLNDSDDNF